MHYCFDSFTLDPTRGRLEIAGRPVELRPKCFDVLRHLLENGNKLISKEALAAAVWPQVAVSDESLARCISDVRAAIADHGHTIIKTVPRRGYLFTADVTRHEHSEPQPRPATPRLSIVVLPFANIGGDPEQDYFVDGVTESLTTDLSRISGSFVIARNTAFTFKGKATDVKQVGRGLNVRYVLEGSVQRGGNRLRVNVQLIDAETGNHLWAERFEKPVADLFDTQDEIVSRLANTLNAQFIEVEARRAGRSTHPDAMDLYFQGWACVNNGTTAEYMTQAQAFFDRALALDPGNIEALVGSARVNAAVGANLMRDDWTAHFVSAEAVLIRALSLAPNHARAHSVLGLVQLFTNRAVQGIAECERALALDHNLADAHAFIGLAKFFLGRSEETEAHIDEALRLSPRDNSAYRWFMFVGLAKLFLGADVEAAAWLRRSIEANRNHPVPHCYLAAALALLGSLDQARAAAQAGLVLNPTFTLRRYRARAASDHPAYLSGRERVCEGMRMAGVPEE
jgi:TolB-like protein/Flp pilus assembly protein TadD